MGSLIRNYDLLPENASEQIVTEKLATMPRRHLRRIAGALGVAFEKRQPKTYWINKIEEFDLEHQINGYNLFVVVRKQKRKRASEIIKSVFTLVPLFQGINFSNIDDVINWAQGLVDAIESPDDSEDSEEKEGEE